jgi:hypothetical protein
MTSRLEMIKKHLANPGSDGAIGLGVNYEEVTEAAAADVEARIAEIDERLERMRLATFSLSVPLQFHSTLTFNLTSEARFCF